MASDNFGSILDKRKRRLTLVGDVDEAMLLQTLLAFDVLDQKRGAITVDLSTYGGGMYEAFGIYDRIKASHNSVTIIAHASIMSAGTIILQAAKKRLLAPNARFMIHYGSVNMAEEHILDATAQMDFFKSSDKPILEDIYFEGIKRKNPNYTKQQLKRLLARDSYMTAEQAVELGLADDITKTRKGNN